MIGWIRQLDRILRGEATQFEQLREGKLQIPIFGLSVLIDLLGAVYGACMGVFALTSNGSGHQMQILASMVKVPALYVLTLIVTFPSLYVFNALMGSRLGFLAVLTLLVASLAINILVLASIGPIVAFFSISTTSYPFMVLLNTVVFAVAGALGLSFLLQTLHRLTIATAFPPPIAAVAPPPPLPATEEIAPSDIPDEENFEAIAPTRPSGPLDATGGRVGSGVKAIFRIWIIVFGLVGSQMGWVLRPFIGAPHQPFVWLRPRSGNFFQGVGNAIDHLFR